MKPIFAYFSMLVLVSVFDSAFAQQIQDSILLKPGEVTYTSAFEEQVLKDFLNQKSDDYFSLFLCSDSLMTSQKALEDKTIFSQIVNKYNTDYYRQMNEKKKVQKIYSSIHEEMLDKYTPLVPFSAIFSSKEFHCVSSSMLYALIFEELDIPYEIREMPNHVYLVAYPSTSYITVETTDPLYGTITYDQAFKAKFVDYLRDAKLISKDEYNQKGMEVLFEEHFNDTKSIDLIQLAGLQYRNQAYEYLEHLDYHRAMQCQEKAYLLSPDTLSSYLLLWTWLVDYSQMSKVDLQCAVQLGKLSRFCGKGVTADVIIGEFAQITQRQLLYEGDEDLYDSSYRVIISGIKDSALLHELSFLYNYERGRILCNNREFMEAIPYTQKAFELKPKNSDAKNNLLFAINNTLEMQDPIKRLEQVNQIAADVPALMEDNLFAQLRLSMYLALMDMNFYDQNITEGEEYRKQFEALYPERISKYQFIEDEVESAYGTASSYYFRNGQLSKARAILEKGLEYAPNSYELKNRLNALK